MTKRYRNNGTTEGLARSNGTGRGPSQEQINRVENLKRIEIRQEKKTLKKDNQEVWDD